MLTTKKQQKFIIIASAFLFVFLICWLLWYLFIPTNVGIFWTFLIIGSAISGLLIVPPEKSTLKTKKPVTLSQNAIRNSTIVFSVLVILGGSILAGMFVFHNVDRAKYFDDKLTYAEGLPYESPINGEELRVVDRDLAQRIMDKSNVFGSNMAIKDIHLGNIDGKTYWIGAASYDSIILSNDHNTIQGFIAVDFTDPTKEPIVVRQKFDAGYSLILNHDLQRIVHGYNYRYKVSDNAYYSFNDDTQKMELIVPYHIQDHVLLGDSHGGLFTQDMWIDGGILRINSNGDVIKDYGPNDRDQVPAHAQIQLYSETWLEKNIASWGKSIVSDHDISWSASALPWARSARRMGIDDDVRVVVDPDTRKYVQYILLDSTDSSNSILRGAIKANSSGLFYYNWEQYNFIDTNSAHDHVEQAVTNVVGTSTHGYKTLLPILYPIKPNVTSMLDYAYVVTLQLGDSRFGGIAITDPSDKTGTRTIVEFAASENIVNVTATLNKAIDRYVALEEQENATLQTGDFTIDKKFSYVESGNTIYVMEGVFNAENQTIVFSRQYISTDSEWITVVTSEVGQTISVNVELIHNVLFATAILGVT